MTLKRLTEYPIHILLLPVFFIWHIYNEYLVIIQPGLYLEYLVYYLGLSLVLFITGKILYKDNRKAGCWTSSLLIIFFFWGTFHDFLRSLPVPGFFVSYVFLLSLVFILILLFSFLLRKKRSPAMLNRFLNLLFILFVTMEAALTVYKLANKEHLKKDWAYYNEPLKIAPTPVIDQQKPDIFFIVFDEYTSSKALQRYFGFDNSHIDSALQSNGFFISTGSQSNYNSTTLSLASTLNLQYFNRDLEKWPHDAIALLRGSYSLKKSFIPRLLEKQGYKILNYGLLDLQNHPAMAPQPLEEYKIKALSLETLWGRIQKEILWNFTTRLPGYTENRPPDTNYINRNRNNFNRFLSELNKESSMPRFVVSHLLLPRRPAYIDRYGTPRAISPTDFQDKNHDSLYLEQLLYANTLIDSLAEAANKVHARPLVLIIEGDHGNRYAAAGLKYRDKHFMNLNVYYFSDKDYSLLYDSISPVNSFRVVLNKYFNAGLPLLKDSTIKLN